MGKQLTLLLVLAGLLGLGVGSALAQQAPVQKPATATDPGILELPQSSPPFLKSPPPKLPSPGGIVEIIPSATGQEGSQPGVTDPSGPRDMLPPRKPVSGGPGPIISSQPPPFSVDPNAPAATNDQNFYDGNRPVQDLSALLAGKFKETKYKWYGFVRLDGIYDFRPIASTDDFVTSSIPVPQGRGQNVALTPRYTRLGFDTETPIQSINWTIKTRIELDFFNGNESGAFGSFPPRLRFAWADFGPFLIGQAASLFMDYDVFPNVVDYEGPGGMILMRQPIIAFHCPIGENFKFSIGVEQPYSDIQWFENGAWVVNPGRGIITNPVVRNVQDVPDLTANLRYTGDYGHFQIAGIARKLTYQSATGTDLDKLGYGVNLTGTLHPWAIATGTPRSGDCATPLSKSRFLAQFAAGQGINRYMQDVNGLGLDATFDPVNGFRTIPSYGWFVAYEQWWSDKWISNFTYGEDNSDLTDTLPGNTYKRANYVSANIIWLPVERMGVALEYLYGTRTNKDSESGQAHRIQLGFQYRF